MGLFNKLNRNKEEKNMDNAFVATPHSYANADKRVFGAIALTEGNCTILPLNPKEEYKVDGKKVDEWKMVLVSTTLDKIIGEVDYYSAIKKIKADACKKGKSIIVDGLSLEKLMELAK